MSLILPVCDCHFWHSVYLSAAVIGRRCDRTHSVRALSVIAINCALVYAVDAAKKLKQKCSSVSSLPHHRRESHASPSGCGSDAKGGK